MEKPKILVPEEIKLLPIDDECTLFYHSATMQIYPLKDKEIIQFLEMLSAKGKACAEACYGIDKFDEYQSGIMQIIHSSPQRRDLDVSKASTEDVHLDQVVLPIAGHCTLKCPYCFAQTDGQFNFSDYTVLDVEKTIDFVMKERLQRENRDPLWLIFFGGEPLLRLDMIRYTIHYVKENYPKENVGYSITTNGTILNDDILQLFKKEQFSVLVSIDGPDNEFNLRKDAAGNSSFEKVMRFVNAMKENGINTELRATLVNTNPYLVETFDFFEKLQLPFFISFAYASENKAHNYSHYDQEVLQKIETQFNALQEYYVQRIRNKESILNQRFYQYGNVLRFRTNKNISCGAGRTYFTITAGGDVFACAHYMNTPSRAIGNINAGPEIDPSKYKALKIDTIEECASCWAKYLCLGLCVAQKVTLGKSNATASLANECELERIQLAFYLKLFYYAQTLVPFYYFKKEAKPEDEPKRVEL